MDHPDSIRQPEPPEAVEETEVPDAALDLPTVLRTGAGLTVIPAATAFFGSVAIAPGLLGNRSLPEWCTRGWSRTLLATAGVDLVHERHPDLDPERRYIFVSNHQSHLDVPCIVLSWPGPVRFLAKKQLFAIPIFGQALTALGHVKVDRGNRKQAQQSLAGAVEPLRNRVSLLFFAEGTRSDDGSLGRFKKGAVLMAEASHVPVVPLAVSGTREVLPKGSVQLRPGRVGVSVGAPMEGLDDPAVPREERVARLREAVGVQLERARALRAGG